MIRKKGYSYMAYDSVNVTVEDNNIDFESIKIGLASPELIREWSYGEVPSLKP